MAKQRVYVLIFSSILADKTIIMNTYRNHFSRSYENRSIKTSNCHSKASLYRVFGPRYMSLKCNDREGQERHFQAGIKAEPGGPRCTTLALRQLENLCFFIQIICWVPLISFSFRALGSLNNDSDERFT